MAHEKVILGMISIIAFLGNSLTVLLFIKKSEWLKKTYNCLILALAIQDIYQAIFIVILPGYILHEDFIRNLPAKHLDGYFVSYSGPNSLSSR